MCRNRVSMFPLATLSVVAFAFPTAAGAQTAKLESAQASTEQRASLNLEAARFNPLQLRNFLLKMPKGSDLHNHLYGAVNAETWIKDAAEDGMCLDPRAMHGSAAVFSIGGSQSPSCFGEKIPAADAFKNQHLYDDLINAFSMRNFVPSAGVSGHDHFFNTFARFNGISEDKHLGEWIDEVAARAGRQNVQYIELMHTPPFRRTAAAAYEIGWQDDLAKFRDALLARGVVAAEVAAAKQQLDASDADRATRERCSQPDASPACHVELRYLCQVLRGFPKQQVFAHLILCFETASADPRFVGINMVMPEDGYYSMSEYSDQMRMVGFLHRLYPKVRITLHAGEIAPPLVSYDAMCCHIRLAVETAGAERIGHGVDVMWEDRPHELLHEMAAKHAMVEINLTSNDVILGISGKNHPLPLYRQFDVPVSLSTDDEGVSRSDMTNEYVRLIETYGLKYTELKSMVRTGIEHIFLSGASLWAAPDKFTAPAAACSRDRLGAGEPSAGCAQFLKSSEKAQQQWELEKRFHEFEAGL